MKKNYYSETNINQLLARTEVRMVELKIILIDAQLKALNDIRRTYPAQRTDDTLSSAPHTAAFPS